MLLISIDGMHEEDLARFIAAEPNSSLARLSRNAIAYRNARTPVPSDSFPGLVALTTGASPALSGVYYDDSYDRALSPAGSHCEVRGAEVVYDDSIDRNSHRLDGGGAIDPARLPRDPRQSCAPVYPHTFLKVNTIFEVVHRAGGRTAWADKHLAYDFLNGPSGEGVDDLYTPEIAAVGEKLPVFPAYDNLKVDALVKQIEGSDSLGRAKLGVPALFGMNFQHLSVAQKSGDGYLDGKATPGKAIQSALLSIDASIGRIVDALRAQGLLASTLVVITSKHGQSPMDPSLVRRVDPKSLLDAIDHAAPGAVAKTVLDDVGLIWLKHRAAIAPVVRALRANAGPLGIARVYAGSDMPAEFGPRNSRTPDIVVQVVPGVIYTRGTKLAEHGGFTDDDRRVPLLLSRPDFLPQEIDSPVSTRQVAPTILSALGLAPSALDAVRKESVRVLPELEFVGSRR
ncbi:alkaline phosphatase family protein [Pandoraea anhela]|uniref:alkaline phosphatase family protein n=1 Tax=Pandoraea anhela TaxID=2508295 RepID=UPI001C2D8CEF|nr:alkaline phosphatase family protein [Pandoraea anhela]